MRITIVINSLSGGGAERAAVLLAEGLVTRDHQVSLVTIFPESTDFYQLSEQVTRVPLGIDGKSSNPIAAISNNLNRLRILRKSINSLEPDLVISYLYKTNVLTLLALIGSKCPVIVSEQNHPQSTKVSPVWNQLRSWVYPLASKVVSTSKGVDAYFDWMPPAKREVIYNPLAVTSQTAEDVAIPPEFNPEKQWLIAMGRLTEQKAFDVLLQAFARIAQQYSNWQLLILGEGELRGELEQLKTELGLGQQVVMPGLIANPFPLLRRGQLFVLSSRYEGFGNVIIEAMACGLPVISTDCPSGPSEIIQDDISGLLVPVTNVDALAQAMATLMSRPDKRQQFIEKAQQGLGRFELQNILDRWEELFMSYK
ncbi:glycosyltransferase [Xenococcus sp. PCC 7305]|uniref:glycosyltransferase family 4 protein n=1 Tax=Xenococcus sp. PCC 7305 TaxID=102125 RepID=UPI0002AC8DEF|nr:glycosyltransferase family 4 protein [Xenococcus sp. PCC 7305]ELS03856.1 glycosyltransferase [Xenococcus sp. PCC 7305]